MNLLQHIEKVINKQSTKLIAKNHLRLKVSIDVARLCLFQGIAFRVHNEYLNLHNPGNFLEITKHTASYSDEVKCIVLENAPQNASYTSSQIQKKILSLYASTIQIFIREEIFDTKYCLIMDESRDESKKEQIVIFLRFVDKESFIQEMFFDIIHVEDTTVSTLKRKISVPMCILCSLFCSSSILNISSNNSKCYTYQTFFSHLVVIVNLLYQVLSKIEKSMNYYLMDRLIKLILTLLISTATTERTFSSMNSLLMYIKKEIAQTFSIDSIIDEFDVMKKR
ncbi:hypothetical protein Pfo_030674 [Paulownia fortunei]|nr:hypothetical protein Pfo_030674 [Paulownia fortunei]